MINPGTNPHRTAWAALLKAIKKDFDYAGKLPFGLGALQALQLFSWVNTRYGSNNPGNDWADPEGYVPGEPAQSDEAAADSLVLWAAGGRLDELEADETDTDGTVDYLGLCRAILEEQGPISDPYWLDQAPRYVAAWPLILDGWMGWDYTRTPPALAAAELT
jgi:hypothetical protein